MTHSKRKLAIEEIDSFRKFLEARGFKCRNGKGRDQLLQVKNTEGSGQHIFTKNSKDEVIYPPMFESLIQVFKAPVDPAPAVEVIDRPASHDSDLLDDFAISALQGILANKEEMELVQKASFIGSLDPDEVLARRSYSVGLAMMAERAKHQPK